MGRYDPMKPGEIRDFDYHENQLMMLYYTQDATLMQQSHALDRRLSAIKDGKRMWGLYKWVSRELLTRIFQTVPDKRMHQYDQLRRNGKICIKISPLENVTTDLIVDGEDFNVIASTAIENVCPTCMREGKEIGRCPLRQAMISCVPPKETCAYGCEYQILSHALMELADDEEGGKKAWEALRGR